MGRLARGILERMLDLISPEPNGGCWLWIGKVDEAEYGRISLKGSDGKYRPKLAHRIMYALVKGTIPEGLDIDHLCRVHCCVNPAHLEAVTRQVNLQRGIGVGAAGRAKANAQRVPKTHCPQGHEFTKENTYHYQGGKYPFRQCRACMKVHDNNRRTRERKATSKLSSPSSPKNDL